MNSVPERRFERFQPWSALVAESPDLSSSRLLFSCGSPNALSERIFSTDAKEQRAHPAKLVLQTPAELVPLLELREESWGLLAERLTGEFCHGDCTKRMPNAILTIINEKSKIEL